MAKGAKTIFLVFAILLVISIFSLQTENVKGVDSIQPLIEIQGDLVKYTYPLIVSSEGSGKNIIELPFDSTIKASELLSQIPSADAISHYDPITKTSYGYISAFGGVGKDFILEKNLRYEINVKSDHNLIILTSSN